MRLVTATLTFTVDDTVTERQIRDLVNAATVQIEEPYVPTEDGLGDDWLGDAVQIQHVSHTVTALEDA